MIQHTDAQFDEVLTKQAAALLEDRTDFAVVNGAIPMIPTTVFNGTYKVWKAADMRRRNVEKRANGSEFKRVNLGVEEKTFSCNEEGYEVPIADRNRLPGELDDTANKMGEDAYANFDIRLAETMNSTYFTQYKTGATDFTKWSDASSTPITDVKDYKKAVKNAIGVNPDSMILTEDVFIALTENAQIIARMSTCVDKKVTVQKLSEFFGIKNIYVMAGSETTSFDGADAATFDGIKTDTALIYYRGTVDGASNPSAVKCFYNTATYAGNNGVSIQTYREEKITSDIVRVVQDFVIKVTMAEGAMLLVDVL